MKQIILASASPRRRELLTQIGFVFTVIASDIEENPKSTLPQDIVIELSKEKAKDVWRKMAGGDRGEGEYDMSVMRTDITDRLVISADTVVEVEGEILGKPEDAEDAARMLRMLSGKEHHVYTGVTLLWADENGKRKEYSFYACTGVLMYHMSEAEIMEYIGTGEPMDKAGAYGVQGRAAAYMKTIRGEYSNVVGLPVGRLYQEMKRLGFENCNGKKQMDVVQ